MTRRPTEEAAFGAIEKFLLEELGSVPEFDLVEDGDVCWSFWVLDDDTTSYVHSDLSIEWYGTNWSPSP